MQSKSTIAPMITYTVAHAEAGVSRWRLYQTACVHDYTRKAPKRVIHRSKKTRHANIKLNFESLILDVCHELDPSLMLYMSWVRAHDKSSLLVPRCMHEITTLCRSRPRIPQDACFSIGRTRPLFATLFASEVPKDQTLAQINLQQPYPIPLSMFFAVLSSMRVAGEIRSCHQAGRS